MGQGNRNDFKNIIELICKGYYYFCYDQEVGILEDVNGNIEL